MFGDGLLRSIKSTFSVSALGGIIMSVAGLSFHAALDFHLFLTGGGQKSPAMYVAGRALHFERRDLGF